jgi:TonB family protein
MLLKMVRPVYPPMARQSRLEGAVRLSAIISKEGKVIEVKIIEGNPLLVIAALDAVKEWRYRPTLQGGQPVEVATEITVVFHLQR